LSLLSALKVISSSLFFLGGDLFPKFIFFESLVEVRLKISSLSYPLATSNGWFQKSESTI